MMKIYCGEKIEKLMKYLKSSKEVIVTSSIVEDSMIKCMKEEYSLPNYGLIIHIEKRAIKSEDYKFKFIDINDLNTSVSDKGKLEEKILKFEKDLFSKPKKEKSFFEKYFPFLSDDSDDLIENEAS